MNKRFRSIRVGRRAYGTPLAIATGVDMFQHDGSAMFRFVLQGSLSGASVDELEQAWKTAQSTLFDRVLLVETYGLTDVDSSGIRLLSRMRDAGASVHPAAPGEPGPLPGCFETSGHSRAQQYRNRLKKMLRRLRKSAV